MDKEEDNTTTEDETIPVYPEATKGPLSEDHSDYGTPKTWAGGDPDKYMNIYFIIFVIIMMVLFALAVISFTGTGFL